MGLNVLYITFTDFGEVSSGSGVRPYMMYNAFVREGHNVKLLEGQQNKREQRKKKVKEVLDWLEENQPDICYVEPPTGPFFNRVDRVLLKKVHEKNIPIGLFYRDFYWKYPKWAWPNYPFWKRSLLVNMHRGDLRLFDNCCDVVYFSSSNAIDAFGHTGFKSARVLPPGSRIVDGAFGKADISNEILYVGGTGEADGIYDLIDAVNLANADGTKVRLNIVTGDANIRSMEERGLVNQNISCFTGSGDDLIPLYKRSDIGIVPRKRHFYMDMAVPVKLFEYISNGLPVIVTDCPAMKELVEQNDCGISCGADSESIKRAIDYMYSEGRIPALRSSTKKAVDDNLWEMRVRQIIKDLKG